MLGKIQIAGPMPVISDSEGQWGNPGICISDKSSGDARAAGLGTTLWESVLGSLPPNHRFTAISLLKLLLWFPPVCRTESRLLGKAHGSFTAWPCTASSADSLFAFGPALHPRKLTCVDCVSRFCALCLLGRLQETEDGKTEKSQYFPSRRLSSKVWPWLRSPS